MTREEKIKALVENVEDWDIETLIEWVKEDRQATLEDKLDEDIDEIYHNELE